MVHSSHGQPHTPGHQFHRSHPEHKGPLHGLGDDPKEGIGHGEEMACASAHNPGAAISVSEGISPAGRSDGERAPGPFWMKKSRKAHVAVGAFAVVIVGSLLRALGVRAEIIDPLCHIVMIVAPILIAAIAAEDASIRRYLQHEPFSFDYSIPDGKIVSIRDGRIASIGDTYFEKLNLRGDVAADSSSHSAGRHHAIRPSDGHEPH